ncbi:hypothetical protein [Metabacillus fastidiosus]|uniref:hypothetical protein n=1 Tax=Metabacillus fastidiosus TaxID=1458 RepID=UPI002E22FA54|nr:hypothetical protein [Metabacillus fastidiosus]
MKVTIIKGPNYEYVEQQAYKYLYQIIKEKAKELEKKLTEEKAITDLKNNDTIV